MLVRMRAVWILGGIVALWLIIVSFGFLIVYTAHDSESGDVLWYEVCLEYKTGSICPRIPKAFMELLRMIGVRHTDSTIRWISEDPFGLNSQDY